MRPGVQAFLQVGGKCRKRHGETAWNQGETAFFCRFVSRSLLAVNAFLHCLLFFVESSFCPVLKA